jgi:FdhE protein
MGSALDSLVREHPEIEPAAAALRTLATALPEATLPPDIPHLGAAEARLAGGVPALEGEPLLSGSTLLANLRHLATALGSAPSAVLSVVAALEDRLPDPAVEEMASAAQSGAWDWITATAVALELEPDLLVTLTDHAARPALRAGANAVRNVVATSRWTRGTCPSCGSVPLLSELRGSGTGGQAEGERVLRCARCLTGWSYPRLGCVGCGESDHKRLSYLHGADQAAFRRADVCSTCNTYLKSIAVLAPLSLTELLAADLATAALDLAAVERGFHR